MCSNQYEYWVHTYSDMVYKLALSQMKNIHNAEDVFQEVFLNMMRCKKVFESNEHEKAYILRTTVNCCKKYYGSAWNRHRADYDENVMEGLFADSDISDEAKNVYYAVMELPQKYRTVIHAFYYEDMSITMIAEALHTKEGTVKSQLNRARAMLKELLAGE